MSENASGSNITNLPMRCATFLGVAGAIIFSVMEVAAIFRSTSSTAVIGLIFLPFAAIIIFMVVAFVGFWIGVMIQGVLDRQYRYSFRFILAIIILVPVMYYSVTFSNELYSTYRNVNRIETMNTQELDRAYADRPVNTSYGYDIYVVAAIAQNPNTSSALLDQIAHLEDPRLHDRLGSIIDLTKGNRKGLAAIRLVALNPNVSAESLEYLTDSNNYYLLGDLARNSKLSEKFLYKLYDRAQNHNEGYLIEWGLAYNPNTPIDILRRLAKKIDYDAGFDPINSALSRNPSTPEDVKKRLVR